MIRLLIFLLWVVLIAAVLTLLFSIRSSIPFEAFGWRMDIPAGVAALCALAFTAVVSLATSTLKDLAGAPKALRIRREIERRERGVAALTRGLESIAAGDGKAARREAQAAARALGSAPVAKLIAAQAAQLAGDDVATGEALAEMLDSPETEFLALRGLYARAMRAGDFAAAQEFASRAFDRRDKARWAFEAVFDLALDRNDFVAARAALERAIKAKAVEPAKFERALAAILTAKAFAAEAAGDNDGALADADAALKYAPGLAPAAILAAKILTIKGDPRKAEKILAAAFAVSPELSLVDALDRVASEGAREERSAALDRLAAKNPECRAALAARARASLLRGDAAAAADLAAQLLRTSATSSACLLMAEAQAALAGDLSGRQWLIRAAKAPAGEAASADVYFGISAEGWRRVIRNYMEQGTVFPPALSARTPGLGESDLAELAPLPSIEAEPAIIELSAGNEPDIREEKATEMDELLDRDADAARSVN